MLSFVCTRSLSCVGFQRQREVRLDRSSDCALKIWQELHLGLCRAWSTLADKPSVLEWNGHAVIHNNMVFQLKHLLLPSCLTYTPQKYCWLFHRHIRWRCVKKSSVNVIVIKVNDWWQSSKRNIWGSLEVTTLPIPQFVLPLDICWD